MDGAKYEIDWVNQDIDGWDGWSQSPRSKFFCQPEHGIPAHPLWQGDKTFSRISNVCGHQVECVKLSSDQPKSQVIKMWFCDLLHFPTFPQCHAQHSGQQGQIQTQRSVVLFWRSIQRCQEKKVDYQFKRKSNWTSTLSSLPFQRQANRNGDSLQHSWTPVALSSHQLWFPSHQKVVWQMKLADCLMLCSCSVKKHSSIWYSDHV